MIKLNALIAALALSAACLAEDRGYCPPPPSANVAASKKAEPPASSDPDKKYFGTVTLLTVISDKGYVCSTHVLHGINQELNKKTETSVRGWHFDPARKNGHPVPVVVSLDVNYWTTSTGEIVSDPPPPQSSVASKKPVH
jgi:hypothetical protein